MSQRLSHVRDAYIIDPDEISEIDVSFTNSEIEVVYVEVGDDLLMQMVWGDVDEVPEEVSDNEEFIEEEFSSKMESDFVLSNEESEENSESRSESGNSYHVDGMYPQEQFDMEFQDLRRERSSSSSSSSSRPAMAIQRPPRRRPTSSLSNFEAEV